MRHLPLAVSDIENLLRQAGYTSTDIEVRNTVSQEEQEETPEPVQQEPVHEESVIREDPVPVPQIEEEGEEEAPVIVREELSRFSSAMWFQKVQEKVIILAGVGGIGSWAALLLAKLSPKEMYLYDMDVVELHNLAGQLYSKDNVRENKVDALAGTILNYTGYGNVFAIPQAYESGSLSGDIMICGFDNMRAREVFYEAWKERLSINGVDKKNCLFIDGRLTANELQILCLTGTDDYYMQQYERRFLFPDSMAVSEQCSFKQTGYMANMIGSLITNLVVNFCANQCNPPVKRALPFFTQYHSDYMLLDKEV